MSVVVPDSDLVPALSSTVSLAAGATFTSPWIEVDATAAIRCGALLTQDGVLTTQHSNDNGVTIIRSSVQPTIANRAEFLSFHPRGRYFRVLLTNSGSSTTTVDLTTHISSFPIQPTASLVSATLARTSLALQTRSMLYDYKYDSHGVILPGSRDLLMASRNSLIADDFTGALDTSNWTTTVAGTGTSAIVSNQKLRLETGVTANSTVKFNSNPLSRFIAGNISAFKAGIELPDVGQTNNVRRWGIYNANAGYYFELSGTTLRAVGRKGGVDTPIASTSWNQITSFALTAGAIHSFEITYFADVAYFIIDDEVHHIMFDQGFKGSFPIVFENNNSGGSTTDVIMYVRGVVAQRYGPVQTSPIGRNQAGASTTVHKIGPGNLHRVTINNANVTGTITIYDNTSAAGTVLATINLSAAGNPPPVSLEYGFNFYTGLTVVTSVGGSDITVIFD